MKIAAGIIGIVLGLLVLLQSCAVATTAGLVGNHDISGAGSAGMLVGLLYFVGGAFSFALPFVAAIVFLAAALLALLASSDFADMGIWAAVAFALAILSFFAWRSARSKAKPTQA